MSHWSLSILLYCYYSLLVVLSLYGLHRLAIMWLYITNSNKAPSSKTIKTHPKVTVQLPIFNEENVAARIIDAACRLSWPNDQLEIQILDDSTDNTRQVIDERVAYWIKKGCLISIIRRPSRVGFKAGALANGLKSATGEFITIFDADFIPPSSFLDETMPYFISENTGMVQARWGHYNQNENLLTRLSSTLLDGHFVLEHTARHRSGRFFNFNGTAGIWRLTCILDAGGWQHDTITEDLDISYRAQLRGWSFVFLKDVIAPAEVPTHMRAFKSQQYRWAKGTLQCARKLLPRIWKAHIPLKNKIEASIHLSSNIAYPLTLILCLLMPITAILRETLYLEFALFIDIIAFFVTSCSVGVFYIFAQQQSGNSNQYRAWQVPMVLALGIGISLNQSRAVWSGLFNNDATFIRTPKNGDKPIKKYQIPAGKTPFFECCLAAYCLLACLYLLSIGIWHSVPFLLIFGVGFTYVGFNAIQFKGVLNLHDGLVADDCPPETYDTSLTTPLGHN